jgi:sigma-B regulation protein RsbU (phosphoserine phosphatase)
LENSRLKSENQELLDELLGLRKAIRALNDLQYSLDLITPEANPVALIDRILAAALDAVNSEDGSLLLLDEDTGELVFVEVHGAIRESLKGYRLSPGEGIAGWVVQNRKAQLVPDVHQDTRFSPSVDRMTGFRTISLICVPLTSEERVFGAIEVVNTRSGGSFQNADLDMLLLVARLASLALERAEGL